MIIQLPIGLLGSNCYLVLDLSSSEAAIVDPGFERPEQLQQTIRAHEVSVRYILNTHGHFDHVAGNGTLALPDAALGIHPGDRALLLQGGGSRMFGLAVRPSPEPNLDLLEGTELAIGATQIRVLHTPGHSPGSVCLHVMEEDALLTGDTLFQGGVGRTDLPGGDERALRASLLRIAELPDKTVIYPGHGDATTLQREKRENPWLRSLLLTS